MLGQMYYFGSNGLEQSYGKARYYYELAAETGNANAIGLLGLMYLFGYGVEGGTNYEVAQSLFKQCNEREFNPSPVCLTGSGIMQLYGLGVKQKIDKGLISLAQAMMSGSTEATYQLAKYNKTISSLLNFCILYFVLILHNFRTFVYWIGNTHGNSFYGSGY